MSPELSFPVLLLSLATLFTSTPCKPQPSTPSLSPYISPQKFFPNYQAMLVNFKIFIYEPNTPLLPPHPSATELFLDSLRRSRFATGDGERADLFLLPSAAATWRAVRGIRRDFPFWNRTLGADHVFLSCAGLAATGLADRNVLELKKNAIQISCFPTPADNFVPHKDVALPPATRLRSPPEKSERSVLGYFMHRNGSGLAEQLGGDSDFVVEPEPVGDDVYADRLASSKFCIFEHDGHSGVAKIGEALRHGCVPAVLVARGSPILRLPFEEVLTWQDMAVFVGGGAEELKRALHGTVKERLERMRAVGSIAGRHFEWLQGESDVASPYGCFETVMYQLWLRRHAVRYVLRR